MDQVSPGSSLTRLQFSDVLDDLIDLRVAEHRTERGHRARLAILDTVTNKLVISFCIHELRPLAGSAAAVGMTPPAGRCEQLFDIDLPVLQRRRARLRLSRHRPCQRGSQ